MKGQRLNGPLTIDDKLESLGKKKRNSDQVFEIKTYILQQFNTECSFVFKGIENHLEMNYVII